MCEGRIVGDRRRIEIPAGNPCTKLGKPVGYHTTDTARRAGYDDILVFKIEALLQSYALRIRDPLQDVLANRREFVMLIGDLDISG